ncbi:unnamed protein product [Calicophoron daubneyi]|uniref:RING-type domain-containing protein n=1 Tax=Calicophoron daubneyi TaxID=300641 RepID=A0AAV2TP57_CALDB
MSSAHDSSSHEGLHSLSCSCNDHCTTCLHDKTQGNFLMSRLLCHVAFLFLIFIWVYFEHHLGVVTLVWLYSSTLYVNLYSSEYLIEGRPKSHLFIAFIGMIDVLLIHYAYRDQGYYKIFGFFPPNFPIVHWSAALWISGMIDCSIKLFSTFFKVLFAVTCRPVLSVHKLGTAFAAVEWASILARKLYPTVVWILFFTEFNWPEQNPFFRRMLLTVLYVLFKLTIVAVNIRSIRKIWSGLFGPPVFSLRPEITPEHQCVICHESYTQAAVFPCNHMVCQNCVGPWSNQHPFCPVCGGVYRTESKWRDGSMDLTLQLY